MKGRCACGALVIETDAEPLVAAACHCKACQRRTGSPFGAAVYYPRDEVTISGAAVEFARPTDTGGVMRNRFCPTCGTTLFWTIDARPGHIGVALGNIDDPKPCISFHSVFERSKLEWINLDVVAHHKAGRPRPV